MITVDAIKTLQKELPPVFSRQSVPQLLPGLFAHQSLTNMASRGEGPPTIKVGRKACYEHKSFLSWLEKCLVEKEG